MSKAGKFVKKHPWEAAGAAAALGLGGAGLAGMGPMAGLLGAGAAPAVPEAGAALAGASGLTDLAGATGAPLASTPSVMPPINWKAGLKGASAASKMGLLGGQPPPPPSMGGNPFAMNTPPTPTSLPSLAQTPGSMDPKIAELLRLLQQQRGGMA